MTKFRALIMCMTVCGAALFAQTEADFTTMGEGNEVVITGYKGAGLRFNVERPAVAARSGRPL
jgi:hypothetical protein